MGSFLYRYRIHFNICLRRVAIIRGRSGLINALGCTSNTNIFNSQNVMSVSLLIFFFIALFISFSSIKIIKEYQRAAIFRLGRFLRIGGPGLILLIPLIDKIEIIDLNKWIPEWRTLTDTELSDRVKSVALIESKK
jgi:hypothetical protein